MRKRKESTAVEIHQPCNDCGSHDALALYSDGHSYCFSCGAIHSKNGKVKKEMSLKLIKDLDTYPSMSKRKINEETLRKFNYQCVEMYGKIWHVAPYYNKDGTLKAQHLRSADKQFKWTGDTKKLPLFGMYLWGHNAKRVVVTEGEIDCMTVSQVQENKWPVVSIPSGAQGGAQAFKDNLDWLESFEKVIICFDNDEVGQKAAVECAQILSPSKALIAHLPLKDPSDMYMAGRGAELINCLWQASEYRPEGILAGTELWEEIIKEPIKGLSTPYPELNELTQGIRPSELWLFTAGSGIGKSTIVHEIAYKLMTEENIKLGVMALEESKRKTAERYLGIYLNKPLSVNREGVTEEELREAFDNTIGQEPCRFELYDHFGSTDIDNLMLKIRYMLVGLQTDILILDHISIIVSGLEGNEIDENERRTIDILMTKLRSLVQETQKTILAVCHLRRPPSGGKSWNEGREPTLTDLRGSAALEQLSDVVVALARNQSDKEKSNIGKLFVLKNRPIGTVGEAGYVRYDKDTGRLLPITEGTAIFNNEPKEVELPF